MSYRSAWVDDETAALGKLARDFFATELVPHLERFDRQQQVDRELWRKAGQVGLLCCSVPQKLGGGGGGTFAHDAVVLTEQSRTGDTGFGLAVHSGIVAHYLLAMGTPEQHTRWLPGMASGELVAAVAMTEPGAGSDLKGVATRAVREGDTYRITGSKTFISNGAQCDLVVVVARTAPSEGSKGISLLVVETEELAGFRRGRVLEKLGMHGQDTAEIFFDDVVVPADNLLGEEGQGFHHLMEQLPRERLVIGLSAVGAMERALEETLAYVKQRRAFGGPLFDLQHVRLELAELATVVHASRVFVDSCVERMLDGRLDAREASMAKWWLTENQARVTDRCLQLFGGYGYMREYLISRLFVDARVQKIYGGANEVLKDLIARTL